MKMTKAEKIFNDTYCECRAYIRKHGLQMNPDGRPVAFGSLFTDLDVSIRTCNDVQHFIDSEKKYLDNIEKHGIGAPESRSLKRNALAMVQATLENQVKSIRDFQAFLKAI